MTLGWKYKERVLLRKSWREKKKGVGISQFYHLQLFRLLLTIDNVSLKSFARARPKEV